MVYPLYIISGINGSGKTTLAKSLTPYIKSGHVECLYIDVDELSVVKSHSINVESFVDKLFADFRGTIYELLEEQPVMLVGFGFMESTLPVRAHVHIHLVTASNPHDLEERCVNYQMETHLPFEEERIRIMVKEAIIPYYHKVVRNSDISHLVNVFDNNGTRVALNSLIKTSIEKISITPYDINHHVMDVSEPYFSLIRSGDKPVEGRKISSTWSKVRHFDTLFIRQNDGMAFETQVMGVTKYLPSIGDPLTAYLETETLNRDLPGVQSLEEGRKIYLQWSTQEEIKTLGMIGIQLRVVSDILISYK